MAAKKEKDENGFIEITISKNGRNYPAKIKTEKVGDMYQCTAKCFSLSAKSEKYIYSSEAIMQAVEALAKYL